MDELIDEMDCDEALREAEYDLKVYNAISSFMKARGKLIASREALIDSVKKLCEALTQFTEAFQLCKFKSELDEVIPDIDEEVE